MRVLKFGGFGPRGCQNQRRAKAAPGNDAVFQALTGTEEIDEAWIGRLGFKIDSRRVPFRGGCLGNFAGRDHAVREQRLAQMGVLAGLKRLGPCGVDRVQHTPIEKVLQKRAAEPAGPALEARRGYPERSEVAVRP